MKHETETPSLTKLQEERLKEIREIESKLYYESKGMSKKEHEDLISDMNFLTRKFLYPFDCQNT
jgi:hypothetical protein